VSVRASVARAGRKLENDRVITRRLISTILLTSMAGLALAACSSSSSSAPKPTTPASSAPAASPSASSGSSSTAADKQQITANWQAFFNAKTPVAKRVSLLQDGSAFATIIKSQAGSGLAATATAQVTKVTVITSSEAEVTYSILVGGTPELKNQKGTAVLQAGTWKVGVTSFCGLLALENGGSTSSLPAACKSGT
jgi:glucose/arabinose dehydrogenase